MLHANAAWAAPVRSEGDVESSARDRLPTLPYDLAEFAWLHTGPSSWSAEDEPDVGDAEVDDETPLDEIETALLIDLWHSDVLRLARRVAARAARLDHREAFVLSLVDGQSTVAEILDVAGLPVAEVFAILCELCARGLVTPDQSRRMQPRRPR